MSEEQAEYITDAAGMLGAGYQYSMEYHEVANIFPLMEGVEFDELCHDIAANGLLEPIWVCGGKILDGRNRYRACQIVGIKPAYREYTGNDPLQFTLSLNLKRRHLNESQRAMVAARMANILSAQTDIAALKTLASIERWNREEERKEIMDDVSLPFDAKRERVSMLETEWHQKEKLNRQKEERKIYAARDGNRIKVGVSTIPEARINDMRVSIPDIEFLFSFPGGFPEERILHERLKAYSKGREWFEYNDQTLEIIHGFMQECKCAPVHKPVLGNVSKTMNISPRLIKSAKQVLEQATPEVIARIDAGKLAVSQYARKFTRQEKMQEISEGNKILEASGKRYSVILSDPPWRYDFSFSDSRAVEEHYPTMELEDIKALPVKELAADHSIIFLWCPPAFTKKAIEVLEAWGFEYRTNMVWVKPSIGAGQWVRQRHELLLIGRRGEIPTPEGSDRPDSVIEAPRQEHSKKPASVYGIIEKMYPELERIELFARNERANWDRWGNQA